MKSLIILYLSNKNLPTTRSTDEEIKTAYEQIETVLSSIPKKEYVIILGDWNAKIGKGINEEHPKQIIGNYGLGTQNTRGERLIQFAIGSVTPTSILNPVSAY